MDIGAIITTFDYFDTAFGIFERFFFLTPQQLSGQSEVHTAKQDLLQFLWLVNRLTKEKPLFKETCGPPIDGCGLIKLV